MLQRGHQILLHSSTNLRDPTVCSLNDKIVQLLEMYLSFTFNIKPLIVCDTQYNPNYKSGKANIRIFEYIQIF